MTVGYARSFHLNVRWRPIWKRRYSTANVTGKRTSSSGLGAPVEITQLRVPPRGDERGSMWGWVLKKKLVAEYSIEKCAPNSYHETNSSQVLQGACSYIATHFPLQRPGDIDNRRSILKLIMLGAIFVSAFGLAGHIQAGSISPETDTSALFDVIAKREATAGTDPQSNAAVAIQTSYFEFREATLVARPETPFAPEMPPVGPREEFVLPAEETAILITRR